MIWFLPCEAGEVANEVSRRGRVTCPRRFVRETLTQHLPRKRGRINS
jgi:hypothetical protein